MKNSLNIPCRLLDVQSRVDELRQVLMELYDASGHAVHDEVLRFSYHLERSHTDPKQFLLYLLIIGGTLPETTPYYDFSGADSIERFIADLQVKFITAVVA